MTTARHLALAALAAGAITLAGCSSSSPPEPAAESTTAAPAVDCEDPELSQAEWVEACADAANAEAEAAEPEPLQLGESAVTVGGQSYVEDSVSGGELTLTPTSVVYSEGEDSWWASVVVEMENTGAVPATQTAPIDSASWSVLDRAAQSQADSEYYGDADQWELGGGVLPSGIKRTEVQSMRLPGDPPAEPVQLMYIDGDYTMHLWDLPAENTGPDADELAAFITESQAS